MKNTTSFLLALAFYFMACGQRNNTALPPSAEELSLFSGYERKIDFYRKASPDSAILYARKALELARKLKYEAGEAAMLTQFARINEQYGNFKLAVKYQDEAVILYGRLKDTPAIADATVNLGLLKAREGHKEEGLNLLQLALKIYKKRGLTDGYARTYTSMGHVYERSGDLDKALYYYSLAEEIYRKNASSDDHLALLHTIGETHAKKGNTDKALTYYEEGVNRSAAKGNKKEHLNFLRKAGKAAHTSGDKDRALEYHNKGLEIAREQGDREGEARLLVSAASIVKDEDTDQGIVHLKNALAISDSIGNHTLSSEIYRSLTVLYRQQSRYHESLQALEKHYQLNDSLLNVAKAHKIAALQSSYELAESKVHIESLQLINQKRTFERNAFLLAASAILIILLILIIYYYKTRELNRKLQASNRVKDKLFSIIGHDLRTPIGGISQLLALMDDGGLPPERQKPMIAEMRKQSNATFDILTALLSWGESQIKGVKTQPSGFNPEATILKNMEVLHKQSADKSLTIRNNLPADMRIYGDANHFDFVLRNLLSNAIKFSEPAGRIEIAAKADNNDVVFSVTDHGKGISKEQQQLFIKGNLDTTYGTKGEKGTGIGLMLSKEFIKANNGRIWIKSEPGQGTTFYFSFPKAD